jgi:hypothetical protein
MRLDVLTDPAWPGLRRDRIEVMLRTKSYNPAGE